MKVLDVAVAESWAMLEPWVRTVLAIAARENPSIEAVEARIGRKLDNTRNVSLRDGVAIIPVRGPIFPRANLFTEVSGATSIEVIAQDFTAALENPMVRGIIFDVDSPGGAVSGIHEAAEMVYAARGRKPMATYVSNLMASAGYWFGAATDEIVLDRTSSVGSLGVLATMPDPSKTATKDLTIVSSQSPKKRLDPSTEMGRAEIQARVDKLADIMIDRVATYRGMTPDDVMRAEGGVLLAAEAIQFGLADRMGSMEGLIAEMKTGEHKKKKMPMRPMMKAEAQETEMSAENTKSFTGRIAAFFGFGAEAAEPTQDEILAAAEEKENEIKRLRAELDEHRAKADAARIAAEEETSKAVDAFVTANVEKYSGRLGQESVKALEGLLRGVKAVKSDELESSLLAFVDSLPPAAPTSRVEPAHVETEAVAEKIAEKSALSPSAQIAADVDANLQKRGLKPGTPDYYAAYGAEAQRVAGSFKK